MNERPQAPVSPCHVCGQSQAELFALFFDGSQRLWQCRRCGYVSPGIGPGRWQRPTDIAGADVASFLASGEPWQYPHRRRVLRDIATRLAHRRPGGTLLDIGCGDGQFLALARSAGLAPSGIEAHGPLADHAASHSQCPVHCGDARAVLGELAPSRFDIVTFIQSLEHFDTPLALLQAARAVLKPAGLVVIELPSIHAPHWLAWRITGQARFIDNPWGVIVEHAGYYTPRSLRALTARAGLKTLQLTTGRWRYKYAGAGRVLGTLLDPLLDALHLGGMFYIGQSAER